MSVQCGKIRSVVSSNVGTCLGNLVGHALQLVGQSWCGRGARVGSLLDSVRLSLRVLGMGDRLGEGSTLLGLEFEFLGGLLASLLGLGGLLLRLLLGLGSHLLGLGSGLLGSLLGLRLCLLGSLDGSLGLGSDGLLGVGHLLGELLLVGSGLLLHLGHRCLHGSPM